MQPNPLLFCWRQWFCYKRSPLGIGYIKKNTWQEGNWGRCDHRSAFCPLQSVGTQNVITMLTQFYIFPHFVQPIGHFWNLENYWLQVIIAQNKLTSISVWLSHENDWWLQDIPGRLHRFLGSRDIPSISWMRDGNQENWTQVCTFLQYLCDECIRFIPPPPLHPEWWVAPPSADTSVQSPGEACHHLRWIWSDKINEGTVTT